MTTTTDSRTTDQHGLAMTSGTDAAALFDEAIDGRLAYDARLLELLPALSESADTPMIAVLLAYLNLETTDQPAVAAAQALLAALDDAPLNPRERAHRDVIGRWAGGDWHGAARLLDDLLRQWPTDVLALIEGHALDFFLGDAANLRDRPGRTLLELDATHPHAGFVRGMQAFGLEESGHYELAEETALAALDSNRRDVWATHAAVHSYEMRGHVARGIRFLESTTADWGSDNLFTVHNWWHLAVFHLEAGTIDETLAIHDREVRHDASADSALPLIDASALLWRLHLDGVDVGDRWRSVADGWSPVTTQPAWYAFNDLHAVLALVGAGRLADAEAVIERLSAYVHRGGDGSNVAMTAEIGLPACRAVVRFAQQRYDDVVAELLPIRGVLNRFGGSHAQRDVLQRTLLEAALRAGRHELARWLTAERLAVRETSVYGWLQRGRALQGLGDDAASSASEQEAMVQRTLLLRSIGR